MWDGEEGRGNGGEGFGMEKKSGGREDKGKGGQGMEKKCGGREEKDVGWRRRVGKGRRRVWDGEEEWAGKGGKGCGMEKKGVECKRREKKGGNGMRIG